MPKWSRGRIAGAFQEEVSDVADRVWVHLIVFQTALLELFVIVPDFLTGERIQLGPDAALFAYSGWLWAETSSTPYLHVWDIKPPAVHVLSGIFSLLTGGNPTAIALLSMVSMAAAIVGSTVLMGLLVYSRTSNPVAAYIAGLVPLTYPTFYHLAGRGLRPKTFVICFGLLGVYLTARNRWRMGGLSAAIAAGFWQFGIIFPGIVLTRAALQSRKGIRDALIGMGVAFLIIVGPVVASSVAATDSMLTQVIATPIHVTESTGQIARFWRVIDFSNLAFPVISLGIVGGMLTAFEDGERWIAAGTVWFLVQVFVFDFDGSPDLILLVVFAALGFGMLSDAFGEAIIPLCLVIGVVFTIFLMNGGLEAFQVSNVSELQRGTASWHYWNSEVANTCHVRLSGPERAFVNVFGGSLKDSTCQYSFIETPLW